jgi:FKBP-type peptidyl-prolyl cis-trans isomerase
MSDWQTISAGLQYQDIKMGDGAYAVPGTTVTVHYIGMLADSTVFDSSRQRGEPFTFRLGYGEVIEGWDKGVVGMQPGAVRRLVIPPTLGYGASGAGPIPGNATLHFEIEMLVVI